MATCGEVLVKILENYGVDTVFGIPGVHTVELYRGLPETNLKHITPRHEQGAGFMADGYTRASGKPGVCLIITGPGMTNIATAMGQAMADSIPMLVISSVNRTYELAMGEGRLHELPNQRNMMSGVSVFSHTLMRPDELPKILAKAFTVFNSARPGPVHIEIPIDVITAPADHIDTVPFALPEPPAAAPKSVAAAVELLSKAQRPLIAIGGGAVDAGKEVLALAEKLGAPVVNTVNAKGVVPFSHDLAVGGSGSFEAIRKEFMEADVVLGVGTEFGETDYDFFFLGDIQVGGKLIRIDIDAEQLTRNLKADVPILSDAASALSAIHNALTVVASDVEAGIERAKNLCEEVFSIRNEQYASFFETVREALPDVIVAGDSTQPTYYAWVNYETEMSRRYFHSASGYGTLGYSIPAAIGAKLARPNLPVIGLIGDGASQFTIGELASAVEARVPVIFLIWNNTGYGEIKRFMEDGNIEQIGVNIYTPDFMGIGKAFGCEVVKVDGHQSLKAELITANERNMPTVIEVPQDCFADGYA